MNVLKKPKEWNGRPASAEYFVDAALKYKSEESPSYIISNSVLLELGKNNAKISEEYVENVNCVALKNSLESLLSVFGR